jgi:hypothetical protein
MHTIARKDKCIRAILGYNGYDVVIKTQAFVIHSQDLTLFLLKCLIMLSSSPPRAGETEFGDINYLGSSRCPTEQ